MEDPHFESNLRLDDRHRLPTGIVEPTSEEDAKLEVMRCKDGCGALFTEFELRRYGLCPYCGNHKFNRSYPNRGILGLPSYERLRIIFWDILKNWRVYGSKGWGWNNGSPICKR